MMYDNLDEDSLFTSSVLDQSPAYHDRSLKTAHSKESDITWYDFKKEHSKHMPVIPNSDAIIPRSINSSSSVKDTKSFRSGSAYTAQEFESEDQRNKSTFSSYDRSDLYSQGWSLAKGIRNRPLLINIDRHRDIAEFSKRLEVGRSIRTRGSSSTRSSSKRSEPLLWPLSSTTNEKYITIHDWSNRYASPGPKYNLQSAPISKGSKGRAVQSDVIYKDITFPKEKRMPDEPERSPGPKFYPSDSKGIPSQNQKGAPRLHGNGRLLKDSIYYDSFHSPSPGVIYNTVTHFDSESKRTSILMSSVIGRPGFGISEKKKNINIL